MFLALYTNIESMKRFMLTNSASIVLNFISLLAIYVFIYGFYFRKLSPFFRKEYRYISHLQFGAIGGILGSITVVLTAGYKFGHFYNLEAVAMELRTYFVFIALCGGGWISGLVTWVCIAAMRWIVDGSIIYFLQVNSIDMVVIVFTLIVLRMDLSRTLKWVILTFGAAALQSGLFIFRGMAIREAIIYFLATMVVSFVVYCFLFYVIQAAQMFIYFKENAMQDYLTKLDNVRALHAKIIHLVKRLRYQEDKQYVVVIADIDHFKRVNDTFGHAAGDEVLKRFASLLAHYCPKDDIVARMGGEEFCVILSANLAEGERLAERLRADVEHNPFILSSGSSIHVTVSFGLSIGDRGSVQKVNDMYNVIDEADKALYMSKAKGRNKVTVYRKDEAMDD